jgi:hypothetical protein
VTAPGLGLGPLFDWHYSFGKDSGQGITLAGRFKGSPNCCRSSSSAITVSSFLSSSVNFGGFMRPSIGLVAKLGSPLMAVPSSTGYLIPALDQIHQKQSGNISLSVQEHQTVVKNPSLRREHVLHC